MSLRRLTPRSDRRSCTASNVTKQRLHDLLLFDIIKVTMVTITIPKRITKGEELVVVQRSEFDVFERWRNEMRDALDKVARGRAEYRAGKTVVAKSPRRFRSAV